MPYFELESLLRKDGSKSFYRKLVKHTEDRRRTIYNVGDVVSVFTDQIFQKCTARIVDFTNDPVRNIAPYKVSLRWFYTGRDARKLGHENGWTSRRRLLYSDHIDFDLNPVEGIDNKVSIERYADKESMRNAAPGTLFVDNMILIGNKDVREVDLPSNLF